MLTVCADDVTTRSGLSLLPAHLQL